MKVVTVISQVLRYQEPLLELQLEPHLVHGAQLSAEYWEPLVDFLVLPDAKERCKKNNVEKIIRKIMLSLEQILLQQWQIIIVIMIQQ
jgi:hypothetical protein